MDNFIKRSSYGSVAFLAAVAGWISYTHALDVARLYGVTGHIIYAYPLTVDGLIYSASMQVLHAARRNLGRWHHLNVYSWCVVGLGVGVTGAVNAWAGLSHGPLGAVVFAWPAVALVLSYEGLMLLIRNATQETPETQRAEVPGVREIKRQHRVGYPKAKQIQQALMNGGK